MLQASFSVGVNATGLVIHGWGGGDLTVPITWVVGTRYKIDVFNTLADLRVYLNSTLLATSTSVVSTDNGTGNGIVVGSWDGGYSHIPDCTLYSMLLEYAVY
jgi:hypothetical protein